MWGSGWSPRITKRDGLVFGWDGGDGRLLTQLLMLSSNLFQIQSCGSGGLELSNCSKETK